MTTLTAFPWELLGKRADTMRYALEHAPAEPTIVETGCARSFTSWDGDGMSSAVFGDWIGEHGGHLWSVDIDPQAVEIARGLVPSGLATFSVGDSVRWLRALDLRIDLLYLDSWDYPDNVLRDLYGGKSDIDAAIATLDAMGTDEIVRLHSDVIGPSQEHAASETRAALPLLHPRSIVVIDDAALPGGGKARLARKVLEDAGWRCILDGYQTVYAR